MSHSIVGLLLIQIVLIALNAVFASAELAVLSVNEGKIDRLAEQGNRKAKRLRNLTKEPAKFLSTIQIAITLSGFLGSAFAADGLESGWRMDEIDRMDMPGFLKMRAWNARQEQKKKEPRQRYIDEVWSSLKPGGL